MRKASEIRVNRLCTQKEPTPFTTTSESLQSIELVLPNFVMSKLSSGAVIEKGYILVVNRYKSYGSPRYNLADRRAMRLLNKLNLCWDIVNTRSFRIYIHE